MEEMFSKKKIVSPIEKKLRKLYILEKNNFFI